MHFRPINRTSATLVLILFTLLGHAQAAWVGEEGGMWLKWNLATRNAYIYAYVAGLFHGFNAGCNSGIDYLSSKRDYKAEEAEDYLKGCTNLSPVKLSKIDDAVIANSVTAFYKAYPQQRFLYISDLILKLLAGHTIDQIHKEFPEGSDQEKKYR